MNLLWRFCNKYNETQEHILQDCTKIKRTKGKIDYNKIFEEDTEPLKEIADEIIKIEECLKEQQLHSMSSSNRIEPPGWPGRMQKYYYYYKTLCVILKRPTVRKRNYSTGRVFNGFQIIMQTALCPCGVFGVRSLSWPRPRLLTPISAARWRTPTINVGLNYLRIFLLL